LYLEGLIFAGKSTRLPIELMCSTLVGSSHSQILGQPENNSQGQRTSLLCSRIFDKEKGSMILTPGPPVIELEEKNRVSAFPGMEVG
jgi:hypothetical protein